MPYQFSDVIYQPLTAAPEYIRGGRFTLQSPMGTWNTLLNNSTENYVPVSGNIPYEEGEQVPADAVYNKYYFRYHVAPQILSTNLFGNPNVVVLGDGRIVKVSFSAPLPQFYGFPDWVTGTINGSTASLNGNIPLEYLGAVGYTNEFPSLHTNATYLVSNTGAMLATGVWFNAYIIYDQNNKRVGSGPISTMTIFNTGVLPMGNYMGGYAQPSGYRGDVYLGSGNPGLFLYKSFTFGKDLIDTAGLTMHDQVNFDVNTYLSGSVPFPAFTNLYWDSYFLVPSGNVVTLGSAGTISATEGFLTDQYGNQTPKFTVPFSNYSLMGPDGFSADSLSSGSPAILYVSSMSGSDATSYATALNNISKPLATVDNACNLFFSNGRVAHWSTIKVLRGDSVPGVAPGPKVAGSSLFQPFVIEDYWNPAYGVDPGTRPIITFNNTTGFNTTGGGGSNRNQAYMLFRRLHLQQTNSSGGTGTGGMNFFNQCNYCMVDDCTIQAFSNGITFQLDGATAANIPVTSGIGDFCRNVVLNRCQIFDSYDITGHSAGVYFTLCKDALISQCTFDRNGWQNGTWNSSSIFSHNAYLQWDNYPIIAWGTLFNNSGAASIQGRPGGVHAYNMNSKSATGAFLSNYGGRIYKCVATEGHDITQGTLSRGEGFSIQIGATGPTQLEYMYPTPCMGQAIEFCVSCNTGTFSSGTAPQSLQVFTDQYTILSKAIIRNFTSVNAGAVNVLGAQSRYVPIPTNQTQIIQTKNVFDGSGYPFFVTAWTLNPPNWNFYDSDYNVLTTTAACTYFGVGVSLSTWNSDTSSESHSIINTSNTYVNPSASMATYGQSLGLGLVTEQDFINLQRARPPRVWGPQYDTTNLINYFLKSYSIRGVAPINDGTPNNFYGAYTSGSTLSFLNF